MSYIDLMYVRAGLSAGCAQVGCCRSLEFRCLRCGVEEETEEDEIRMHDMMDWAQKHQDCAWAKRETDEWLMVNGWYFAKGDEQMAEADDWARRRTAEKHGADPGDPNLVAAYADTYIAALASWVDMRRDGPQKTGAGAAGADLG